MRVRTSDVTLGCPQLRTFTMSASNHPNHVVLAAALQDYLRWRNANARHPDIIAAQRRERAASAANANDAGDDPHPAPTAPRQHEPTPATYVADAQDHRNGGG